MGTNDHEEEELRSVALQNARSIMLARRRAEEALRRQSEWLRVTLSSIGDAVISTDADYLITFMNRVAESLTGWPESEALGRPLEDVFHIINEQSRLRVDNPAVRALKHGTVVGLANHTVLIGRDGTEWAIDDSAAPIRNEQDEVGGAVLIFRDITERRLSEMNLEFLGEISNDLARLDNIDAIIQTVGAKIGAYLKLSVCALIEINEAGDRAVVTHDWHREDVAGLVGAFPFEEFVTGEFQRASRAGEVFVVRDALEDSRTVAERFTSIKVRSFVSVPLIRDGHWRFMLGIFDSKIHNWRDDEIELMREVAARIWTRLERARAEEALKEADRRKNEFLAMLAHELRNPLAPMRNALQIVRHKQGDEEAVQSAFEIMERQISQMVRLVDDLLDVNRISQGKIELRREPVELASAINQAVETCRSTMESASHKLTVMLPVQPIHLYADPMRLAQAFSNLLNNSCKYTEPGGLISVTAELQDHDVLVSVKDSGVGIPANMLRNIFDIFAQVDHSLERAQGGLGIGLTLVKELVEMHGGWIEAQSEGPGKGSEFIVRLPIMEHLADQRPQEPMSVSQVTTAPSPRRILVVDDNEDSAESLVILLRTMGHEVSMAHDGLEAVDLALSLRPDVVLLDIGLPKLNGLEAARRIREQVGSEEMVLVALTGWGQDEDRRRSKEAGFDHHLTKPVEFETLEKLIGAVDTGPRK